MHWVTIEVTKASKVAQAYDSAAMVKVRACVVWLKPWLAVCKPELPCVLRCGGDVWSQEDDIRSFLSFLALATGDDSYVTYSIKIVFGGQLSSFPRQPDAKSCGIFALIILYHIIKTATLHLKWKQPNKQVRAWRNFFAAKMIK